MNLFIRFQRINKYAWIVRIIRLDFINLRFVQRFIARNPRVASEMEGQQNESSSPVGQRYAQRQCFVSFSIRQIPTARAVRRYRSGRRRFESYRGSISSPRRISNLQFQARRIHHNAIMIHASVVHTPMTTDWRCSRSSRCVCSSGRRRIRVVVAAVRVVQTGRDFEKSENCISIVATASKKLVQKNDNGQ